MHLAQTKKGSLKSGGPQYYFHDVPDHIKEFLRQRGSCPVVLQTPYGITSSSFTAVGRDHKLERDKPVRGKVGHDRIQGAKSIGEAIRYWYGLKGRREFKRIDVEAVILCDGHFILIPTAILMQGSERPQTLEKVIWPLTFHHDYQSKLWKNEIAARRVAAPEDVCWAGCQLRRIVAEHRQSAAHHIHEADLLRAAGALSLLGLDLSVYLTKGYDCPQSQFSFASLPSYPCPVEIKKHSACFDYQIMRYPRLPRAVVLCLEHDLPNTPDHVDVVELAALAEYLVK